MGGPIGRAMFPPIPSGVEVDPQQARKRFFLIKEAKTFVHWGAR
jgi:hypothetical protein